MDVQKIALVDYFNTLPFLKALESAPFFKDVELVRKNPGLCASSFYNREVDIALIPIFPFLVNPLGRRVTNYGIGCNGTVRTVGLFSNSDLKEIRKIYLDTHSRTSVHLLKILCFEYWNLSVEFSELNIPIDSLKDDEAVLLIGDKVFEHESRFEFSFDLGKVWKNWTNLPFVFAVWVAHDHVDNVWIKELNSAFAKVIPVDENWVRQQNIDSTIDLVSYFSKNIDFVINEQKEKAIAMYKDYCAKYFPNEVLSL